MGIVRWTLTKMAAKMDAAFQFARTDTLTWSFITQFFPNFIYGLLSSNYSSCQYGFCLMNDTQDSKTDIPFPLQGPVSESHCSSFRIFKKKKFRNTIKVSKQFGSWSGPTFCRFWSGSQLFTKVISRWQKWLLARKELSYTLYIKTSISCFNLMSFDDSTSC